MLALLPLLCVSMPKQRPKHFSKEERNAKIENVQHCYYGVENIIKKHRIGRSELREILTVLSSKTGVSISEGKDKHTKQMMYCWVCENCARLNNEWENRFNEPIPHCNANNDPVHDDFDDLFFNFFYFEVSF